MWEDWMPGWSDDDVLELERLCQESAAVEARTAALVAFLREQGCPWSVIGAAVGVSRQAAQQKWGSRPEAAD